VGIIICIGESVDIWKKNVMEDLENRVLEFTMVRDFLTDLKQEFENENNEFVKVAEMKKIEQKSKTMKKFVQEFRKVARGSSFKK